jgi:hypothetical protein
MKILLFFKAGVLAAIKKNGTVEYWMLKGSHSLFAIMCSRIYFLCNIAISQDPLFQNSNIPIGRSPSLNVPI